MCLEPDSLSSALACPLDLSSPRTCPRHLCLLKLSHQIPPLQPWLSQPCRPPGDKAGATSGPGEGLGTSAQDHVPCALGPDP